jgi:predicted kinase
VLIICRGRSGTGKSTLAAALADRVDAVVVRSDVIRKRDDAAPRATAAERYTPAARAAVYVALAAEADALLAAGRSVIADATFLRRADRDRLYAVAARRRVPRIVVACQADAGRIRERLAARGAGDVSDARWGTYLAQGREEEPLGADEPAIVVDTDGAPADVADRTLARSWAWRVGEDARA